MRKTWEDGLQGRLLVITSRFGQFKTRSRAELLNSAKASLAEAEGRRKIGRRIRRGADPGPFLPSQIRTLNPVDPAIGPGALGAVVFRDPFPLGTAIDGAESAAIGLQGDVEVIAVRFFV